MPGSATTVTSHDFAVWGHGNPTLSRGSGLFVPPAGVVDNHHFNPIGDTPEFWFSRGDYELAIFAEVVGDEEPQPLQRISLTVPAGYGRLPEDQAFYFDWDPAARDYRVRVVTGRDAERRSFEGYQPPL